MKKTLQYIVYTAFFVGLLFLAVMLVRSERKLREMRGTVSTLKTELMRRKTEYLELRQETYDLKNNPHAVERVAREKFKLVGEGEVVYKYDPEAIESEMRKEDDK
ncbi:MAG: septum formation initiator family protein [Kiritimatiellaeota bacterium]|nr:septum formation initiator family protein [Kiritimatiellota bacterium]